MEPPIGHPESTTGLSASRRFVRLLRPFWLPIAGAIGALILLTCVNMATPLLIGMIFSRVFPERDWSMLWLILGALAVLFLLRNLLFFQSKFTAMKVGENVCFNLRTRLFERLQQMRLSFTREHSPGKLSSKVMNDSLQIQLFIQDVLPKFIQAALLFLGIMAMIYVINWQLALASTFVLPLHFLTYRYFGARIKRASRRSQENIELATGNIIEKMLGIEVVKGFAGEARESQAFQNAIESSRQSQLESSRFVVLQKVCADILVGVGMLFLIGFGAYQVIGHPPEQAMQSGEFIAFFWYIRLLYPTVIDLMSSGGKLAKARASIERAFDLLREERHRETSAARSKPPIIGNIEFENVSFSFDRPGALGASPSPSDTRGGAGGSTIVKKGPRVLHNISFSLESGTVCAITGPSGAGKTTLVSMLPLLLEPEKGIIRIDGHDIRQINLRHLRESIGVVFQECFLFNTTVMENLRYARPNASTNRIIEVCEYTGADNFIRQLPRGYNSLVGDNGVNLSRGQKQLITLTRAVIKNPKILILDEATASLDSELEAYVIPTILNLMDGRSTLMITHNSKLLEHADCELCLAKGRIVAFHDFRNRPAALPPAASGRPPGGPETGKRPKRSSGASRLLAMVAGILCLLAGTSAPAQADTEAEELVPLFELASSRVQLSHIDPQRCLDILQFYGFHVGQPGQAVQRENLPTIVLLPATAHHSSVPKMTDNFPLTDSDPIGDLMVFYDPDQPGQLSRVLRRIRGEIDLPARQIMLEAMVLEISETALRRLGVEWELTSPIEIKGSEARITELTLGRLAAELEDQLVFGATNLFRDFDLRLRALVREGEAEVLSRPSILTLDRRMAFINVSEIIPIAHSRFHGDGRVQTVDFREREAGIQLAIRPRISDDGQEISLQINANVSAVVPGQDVQVRDQENRVIASSPTISIREVKTYARIANNTPFIIGGLISQDDTLTESRVPILGSIPLLGPLFRSTRKEQMKREVIIVITPFILPETRRELPGEYFVGRTLPKDADRFDSFDHHLFRDAYRIREEDVYDLDFLIQNQALQELRQRAEQSVAVNAHLAEQFPYNRFVGGRIPGEKWLVYRQIYSVIRRIGLDRRIEAERLIFFEATPERSTQFRVTFLETYLERQADLAWAERHAHMDRNPRRPKSVWEALGDQAIAFVYTSRREDPDPNHILEEQVPTIKLIECPDRQTFDHLLWELNQPDQDGHQRNTLLLHTERDLRRLKQAIVLRDTINLNGPEKNMTLANFSVGRLLMLPTLDEPKIDLIDGRVARLSMATDRYYDLLRQDLAENMAAMRRALELNDE